MRRSTRRLATQLGMSQSAVRRVWRAFGLVPHRSEAFQLSLAGSPALRGSRPDPQFIDTVRDVVGLYPDPLDRALVLSVNEKSRSQATDGTTPVLPRRSLAPSGRGSTRTTTPDTARATSYAALDVRAGTVIDELLHRHRSVEFRTFLDTVDAHTPPELDLHLIIDDSSIHTTPLIQRWLPGRPRVHLHPTPTSASWLNLGECWFALLTTRRPAHEAFRSTRVLEQAIKSPIAATNAHPKSFGWTETADEILESVSRYCQRTTNAHH
jgi:hypothetical protein